MSERIGMQCSPTASDSGSVRREIRIQAPSLSLGPRHVNLLITKWRWIEMTAKCICQRREQQEEGTNRVGSIQSRNASAFPSASIPIVGSFSFFPSQKPSPSWSAVNNFNSLFPSSSASCGNAFDITTSEQQFSGGDEWGFHTQFEVGHDEGITTEFDGLPPPPYRVSASTNYKQSSRVNTLML